MDTKSNRQFDVGGPAGAGNKDKRMIILGFGKNLVNIGPQHLGADNRQMDAREQGDSARLLS